MFVVRHLLTSRRLMWYNFQVKITTNGPIVLPFHTQASTGEGIDCSGKLTPIINNALESAQEISSSYLSVWSRGGFPLTSADHVGSDKKNTSIYISM